MPRRTGFAGFAARRGSSAAMPARRAGAVGDQRADAAGRALRGADGGAEVHQRLRVLAGPRGRGQRRGELDEARLGGGKRGLDREEPRHHPLDVAVDHDGAPAEGDRRHRGGGIGTDAGQRPEPFLGVGEAAAELARHHAGAGQQVAGAGVVAEAGPGGHHLGVGRRGERADRRPAGDEGGEAVADGGHGGLLQHHLGQPDPVGIGTVGGTGRQPPGQRPRGAVVPGE